MKRSSYRERDDTFARMFLTLRTTMGLTQAELASLLGVSWRSIASWENGSYPKNEHFKAFLTLCVQRQAFPAGREAEEIRTLWRTAHQKILLDENWLQELLSTRRPQPVPEAPGTIERLRAREPHPTRTAPEPRLDWGEALSVWNLYGREQEIAQLAQWVVQERCRVVSVLGLGGVGKSALSVALMRQVAPHFQVVIFRSLRDAPSCEELLADCLQVLAPEPLADLPTSLEQLRRLLLSYFRAERALLVLDNLESLLEEGDSSGRMRAGYEGYAQLLRNVAQTGHQSCLLLTSREQPRELEALQVGSPAPVRTLRLAGLDASASEQLLAEKDIAGGQPEREQLVQAYAGNPLALKIAAGTILELFAGDITLFLQQGETIYGSVHELLAEQVARLSASEQTVLLWLAILREPARIEDLLAAQAAALSRLQVLDTLEALRRRSLIEHGQRPGSFTLQSVVLEYAMTYLTEQLTNEIEQGQLSRLIELGLELASSKEYVRQTQLRLLVAPLLARLRRKYRGRDALAQHLIRLLDQVRERADYAQGYGPANLMALLREERGHLRHLDLSRLTIREAYLQGVEMQDTSLVGATLRNVVWTSAFDMILSVAVSPDGRYLAAGSNSGQVRTWREEGRVAYLTIRGHSDRVGAIAFSSDGQALVTTSWDGTVKLWDVESGVTLWTGENDHVVVTPLAISPNGKLMSGDYDGVIHFWDLRTGKHLSRLQTQGGSVLALACSSDGHLLASGGHDGVVRLWDARQGMLLRELSGHHNWICTLAFAPDPDGSLLASGSLDQTVKLWNAETGNCLRTLEGHTNLVAGLAWSPDVCILASASHDTTIRLWDAKTGQCRHILQGHRDAVTSVAFLPTGERLFSGSYDRTMRTWDVQSGQNVRTVQGYALGLYSLAWSSDGRFLVSSSSEATLTLWNVITRTPVRVLRGHRQRVQAVAWSRATNLIASGSDDQTVRIWNAQTGICTHILQGHTASIYNVDWSPNGSFLASGSSDGQTRTWDVQKGASWVSLEEAGQTNSVAWSPDGMLFARANEEGLVQILRAADGHLLQQFEHAGAVYALCWSPGGEQLVSGSADGERGVLSIWDVREGTLVRTLTGHSGLVISVDWSLAHNILVSVGSHGTIRWWNPEQGVQLAAVQAHDGWARAVRISPDGKTVASCGEDGVIKLWDMQGHQHLVTLRADRPYERLNMSNTKGLTQAQRATLQALGAVGVENVIPPTF